jgi:hypothetical protein
MRPRLDAVTFGQNDVTPKIRIANSFVKGPSEANLTQTQALNQCDQIGRNFDIWATLGNFLFNTFSHTQVVSMHDLL